MSFESEWLENHKAEQMKLRPTCKHDGTIYMNMGGYAQNLYTGEKIVWPKEEPECGICGLPESQWPKN